MPSFHFCMARSLTRPPFIRARPPFIKARPLTRPRGDG